MSNKNNSTCAFCHRSYSEVRKMVMAPDGFFICEDCINICIEILCDTDYQSPPLGLVDLPTPKQIKQRLDEYIIEQDPAKRVLSVAVYNHYKRINYNQTHSTSLADSDGIELKKSNILMLGPTGCGKTLLAQTLAKILDVPFATADATTLTQAGYVGEDVENILLKLIQAADYDIARAQRGIIYVDEIDKITSKGENVSITRDVSGEGVQQALLKIIESTIASVPPQGGRKHPQQECLQIDTTNILFIFGGAFVGLEKIIDKRQNTSSLGFGGSVRGSVDTGTDNFSSVQPQDLMKYGMIPEFVGRVPVVVSLHSLNRDSLISILVEPRDSLVKQYKKLLQMDDVELEFEPGAIEAIAEKAIELKTGARGLRSIMEEIMLDIMFETPTDPSICKVIIDSDVVRGHRTPQILRKAS